MEGAAGTRLDPAVPHVRWGPTRGQTLDPHLDLAMM
jgi:hypothetical protein